MPWNEVSRRYVDDEPSFYFPGKWRGKADNVKQGSSDQELVGESLWQFSNHLEDVDFHINETLELYNHLLTQGVCAEQARMVLPQNTMTTWIWSGTLGAFASMLALRLDPHTQYESRLVAEEVYKIVKEKFPVSTEALLESYKV